MALRFCVNPITLYPGMPIPQAMAAIARAGFKHVELWSVQDEDVAQIKEALEQNGLELAAMCTDFFTLTDPACRQDYLQGLIRALKRAKSLGCRKLITQVGGDTGRGKDQFHSIADGLKAALPHLEEADATLMVEPLNTVKDHIGYYLSSSDEGFDIISRVSSPHVRLLFDIYHQLQMEEDAQKQILDNLPLIAHFHIAGLPLRDERIFSGEYDYTGLFKAVAASPYSGLMGLELFPSSAQAREELYKKLKSESL